jgi:hypothetical protein
MATWDRVSSARCWTRGFASYLSVSEEIITRYLLLGTQLFSVSLWCERSVCEPGHAVSRSNRSKSSDISKLSVYWTQFTLWQSRKLKIRFNINADSFIIPSHLPAVCCGYSVNIVLSEAWHEARQLCVRTCADQFQPSAQKLVRKLKMSRRIIVCCC